jgi:hypothetical protein
MTKLLRVQSYLGTCLYHMMASASDLIQYTTQELEHDFAGSHTGADSFCFCKTAVAASEPYLDWSLM